jgi:hypothetical protein
MIRGGGRGGGGGVGDVFNTALRRVLMVFFIDNGKVGNHLGHCVKLLCVFL